MINSDSDSWVREEFIQACLIMVTFQRLACIAISFGIISPPLTVSNESKGNSIIIIIIIIIII